MSQPSNVSLSYRDAGVDIDAGDALVEAIKPFAKRTMFAKLVCLVPWPEAKPPTTATLT